jgi:hypothetical protein
VVRGGPQAVSEVKELQTFYQTLNELKNTSMHVYAKLPMLVKLKQR